MSQNNTQDVRILMDNIEPATSRESPSRLVGSYNHTNTSLGSGASINVREHAQTTSMVPPTSISPEPAMSIHTATSPTQPKSAHGWTPDARKLVKLWAGQIAMNRQKHQQFADSMSSKAVDMKITAAVFGSAATLLSFLNTTFNDDPTVSIILNVLAGVFAAISTLVGVILAIMGLDTESEKHRQTAIQYANVCNEAQTVLVEEHEEDLPQATDFLRKMKDLTHLIQLFGPSLEEKTSPDLPSIILLHGLRGGGSEVVQNTVNNNPGMVDDLAGIFDHDDKYEDTLQNRKKKRADMLIALRHDTDDIRRRQQELRAEEEELKALSKMLSVQAGLADVRGSSPSKQSSHSAPANINATTSATTHNASSVNEAHAVDIKNHGPTAPPKVSENIDYTTKSSNHRTPDIVVHREYSEYAGSRETPQQRVEYMRMMAEPVAMTAAVPTAMSSPENAQSDDSEFTTDEDEYTMTDSDEVDRSKRKDHISPVIRSSLRESILGNESHVYIPRHLPDNIAQDHVRVASPQGSINLEDIPTSNSSSRTQSGDGALEYEHVSPQHSLTELALNSLESVHRGIKRMQIAPDVLRAEIRRREDKIQAQKRELENQKINNKRLQRKIESERRQNISHPAPRRGSTNDLSAPRRGSANDLSVSRRSSNNDHSSVTKTTSPRDSPRAKTPPGAIRRTNTTDTPRRVIDRLKDVLSPPKSPSKAPEEVVEDASVAQREKMQAIQEMYGDELSFECMREEK